MRHLPVLVVLAILLAGVLPARAEDPQVAAVYARLRATLDAVPAIDTHDHLWPFERLPGYRETKEGRGMNLASIWQNSYLGSSYGQITPWTPGGEFKDWWKEAKDDFDNVRSTSFYRYTLPAIKDLYGVDFDRITDEQAEEVNRQIFANYKDQKWLYKVITERANIELMVNDPYWNRLDFTTYYPFEVLVFNVTPLVRAFHASEYTNPSDSPYEFAKKRNLPMESLDDYLVVLDKLFLEAHDRGAVCLKSTLAYQRTLRFEDVPQERAAKAWGRRGPTMTPQEIKDFEDFIFWKLTALAAKYEIPFQIHTGQARIQGSNPMNLVDLMEANPKTKFILFHGGFPWVGETAVIMHRHWWHCWIDSVWLPMLSYSTAKRALHEWLDAFPSNRILWGADCNHAEGIYGATMFTRKWVAEVLAEKVAAGTLTEEHAVHIGKQILRENALSLFPSMKEKLWKHKGVPLEPK